MVRAGRTPYIEDAGTEPTSHIQWGSPMKTIFAAALSSIALLTTALAEEPADRGLSTLAAGTYVMDKTHGYVTFSYSHMGFSNPVLRFNDIDATVNLVADDISTSTLTVAIDPASIDTGVPKFDTHIKAADFFDIETHKDIQFTSTALKMDTPATGTLTGDLTVKGITQPVTLDVVLNKAGKHPFSGADTFGITATGQLMRSAFGLGAYVPNVSDEVDLRIEAEFSKSE